MERLGDYLRKGREEAGFTLLELAERTRIRFENLQALEDEDLDTLPSDPYVRGFVRLVCREVGLPEQEGLLRYDVLKRHLAAPDQLTWEEEGPRRGKGFVEKALADPERLFRGFRRLGRGSLWLGAIVVLAALLVFGGKRASSWAGDLRGRIAVAAETRRVARAERQAQRRAADAQRAEEARLAAIEKEARRVEAARVAEEEDAARRAEATRVAAAEEEARLAEAARVAAAEEEARLAEAARVAALEEEARLAAAARQAAADEQARIAEAARVAALEEETRRVNALRAAAAEEEARRLAEIRQAAAEEDARVARLERDARRTAAERERQRDEESRRAAAENDTRRADAARDAEAVRVAAAQEEARLADAARAAAAEEAARSTRDTARPQTTVPIPAAGDRLVLRVEAVRAVQVEVLLDGVGHPRQRTLTPGDTKIWKADSLFLVSASDGGALRVTVGGSRVDFLGKDGVPVERVPVRRVSP